MESEGGQGERQDQQHGQRQSQQARSDRVAEDERIAPSSAAQIADETLDEEEDPSPTVEHRAWLKKDDYWRRTTYIAVTGRHTAMPPRSRRLQPPSRFHKPSPVRSMLVFALVVALIVLIPFGVIIAQHEVARIQLPTNVPGVTLPATPTHHATPSVTAQPTVKPTATPKKK